MTGLLPASVCLDVVKGLLMREEVTVKRNALDLLNSKLLQNPTPFTVNHVRIQTEVRTRVNHST